MIEANEDRDIPKTWVQATIGDVCSQPQYGYTTKASKIGDLRLLRTSDITSGIISWETVPYCSDNPEDLGKFILKDGDILVSRAGSVGVSHLVTKPLKAVFASYLIRFKPFINRRFLGYFLNSPDYWATIADEKLGIAVPNINASKLKSITVPVPPAREQCRIVAKIEELFSELDNGVESLKKARTQLKIYRQAVLKHAFEGKLTAKWREENKDKLEKPDQLLARIQQEQSVRYERLLKGWKSAVKEWGGKGKPGKKPPRPKKLPEIASIPHELRVKLPHLPESWVWVRLGNISYVSGGLTKNQKRNILPRKMSYLRVANVYGDKILTDSVHKIGVTESEAQKVVLEMGDLLIVEGNGSVQQIGRVAVWNEELPACGHQNHLIRVRLVTTSSPRFFLQFLLSPLGRDLIVKEASSTSGLYTLSISKVSNLIVPVAGNPEEAEILAQVEQILSNVYSTLEEIDMQLAKSKALRQSILMQAFSGQLVPQDMNDEPASVLLARIRASRGAENIRVEV